MENGEKAASAHAIGSLRTQNTTMKMPHRTSSEHMARTATEDATCKKCFQKRWRKFSCLEAIAANGTLVGFPIRFDFPYLYTRPFKKRVKNNRTSACVCVCVCECEFACDKSEG